MTKSTAALDQRTQNTKDLENLRLELSNKQSEWKELDQAIFELNSKATRHKTNHYEGGSWQSDIHQAQHENLLAKRDALTAQQKQVERDMETMAAEIKRLEPLTLEVVPVTKADVKTAQAPIQEALDSISGLQERIAHAEAVVTAAKEHAPDLAAIQQQREELAAVAMGEKTQEDAEKYELAVAGQELKYKKDFRDKAELASHAIPALHRKLEKAGGPLQAAQDRLNEVTKAFLESEFEKAKVIFEKELTRAAVAYETAIGLGMLAKGNPRHFGEGNQLTERFKSISKTGWHGCMDEQRDRLAGEGIEV